MLSIPATVNLFIAVRVIGLEKAGLFGSPGNVILSQVLILSDSHGARLHRGQDSH